MHNRKQSTNRPAISGSLVPDIVKEIPVAVPGTKSQLYNEDDELDKIMHDVGQDVGQIGKKKPKHKRFSRPKKAKAEPKFSTRPDEPLRPTPAPPITPLEPVPPPATDSVDTPQAVTAQTLAKSKPPASQKPIGVVLLAMSVTLGLIVAAYYAYK